MISQCDKNGNIGVRSICYFVTSVLSIVFTIMFINNMNSALDVTRTLNRLKWRTMSIYIVGIVLFIFVFMVLNLFAFFGVTILEKHKDWRVTKILSRIYTYKLPSVVQVIVVASGSICILFFLCQYMFWKQRREGGFNKGNFYCIPDLIWVILTVLLASLVILLITKKKDIGFYGKFICYVISVVVTFSTNFVLNPFYEGDFQLGYQAAFVNYNILWESIYNVIDGVPFTLDTTPLYGHYALFFLPVRLLSNENLIFGISLIIAIMSSIEQMATLYVIDYFAPKKWIAALLAVGSIVRLTYYAAHLTPIRTLFPSIILFLFVFFYKKGISITKKKIWYIISAIILTLAILCNFEISVGCYIAFISYSILELIQRRATVKEYLINGLCVIAVCIVSVMAAIGIVNIYNLCCGGPIIGRSFFFPLLGCDTSIVKYIQDHFHWPVPLGNTAWKWMLIFLLGIACVCWFSITAKRGERSDEKSIIPLLGAAVCMEIVAFTYYMNEPLWTDLVVYRSIFYCLFSIVLFRSFHILEGEYTCIHHQLIRTVSIAILGVIILGAVQVANDPVRIGARKWIGAYNSEELRTQVSEIVIPEYAYGFGQGVNMIYHIMGNDNHMKYRDTTELDLPRKDLFEKVVEELKHKGFVFIGTSFYYDMVTIDKLKARGFRFYPIKKYKVGSWEYSLCRLSYNPERIDLD